MFGWLRKLLGIESPKDTVAGFAERVKIAKLQVHQLSCSVCGNALLDGDLVVWRELMSGEYTLRPGHAECLVLLRWPDKSITKLTGGIVQTDEFGGVLDESLQRCTVVDEADWKQWVSTIEGPPS